MSKKRRENNEIPSRYNKLAAAFNQAYNAVLQVNDDLKVCTLRTIFVH